MTAPTNNRARSLAFVTAGPTEEPIDAVRFIGNRSSGRMGVALANALLSKGFDVVLALGPVRGQLPVASPPPIAGDRRAGAPRLRLERFCSSSDLERLMRAELPAADLVVMAAAVADFRPRSVLDGKMRRTDSGMQLELEGVPDLLTVTRDWRKAGACVIGFALEPRERLESSAREKIARKDLAGLVANPLETIQCITTRSSNHQIPHPTQRGRASWPCGFNFFNSINQQARTRGVHRHNKIVPFRFIKPETSRLKSNLTTIGLKFSA